MRLNTTIGPELLAALLTMTMLVTMGGTAAPAQTSPSVTCLDEVELPPVVFDVPANGTVTFGLPDLVAAAPDITCLDLATIDASSFAARAAEGRIAIMPDAPAHLAWSGATWPRQDSDSGSRPCPDSAECPRAGNSS